MLEKSIPCFAVQEHSGHITFYMAHGSHYYFLGPQTSIDSPGCARTSPNDYSGQDLSLVCISGVRGDVYPGYEGMYIRGTRGCISGVQGDEYPGYKRMNIRGTRGLISVVQGDEGCKGMNIRGTRGLISGMNIRGTRG